ncbi:hypothetical protein N7516_009352 [Penicillium verrucosum]|uniref:uncharacterized protein n=1 Tax=Penicillium verrucosum TaxID=60171 RepID=UPI0025455E0B|nr:uncharacterized protein N7516_009352 [Penicillium verrucosum]KAJ5927579.1 hypothetical protein N7516_009352 [Penicillium verrucosum]
MTVGGIHDRGRIKDTAEEAEAPGATGRATPRRIPQLPDAEDEAVQNGAIIILLQSISQFIHSKLDFMLISQTRHELFITFVPLEKRYEEYLRNGTNTDAFLVINTFDPFRTDYACDMQEFGQIILAAILILKPVA